MRDTDDEARDCFAVAVSPLSTDDFPVLVDLGGAPLVSVRRVVLGAVDVRLALEAEREDASLGLLLVGVHGADEADLFALSAAASRSRHLTLLTQGLLFLVVEGPPLDARQDLSLRMNGLDVWRSKESDK